MEVDLVGGKFNLTDVAARVGLGQLQHLAAFNTRRRALARAYFAGFEKCGIAELGLQLPRADFVNSNWHMFQVVLPEERLTVKRAEVMAEMHAAGIGTGVHYPAIHLFALYQRLGWKAGDFPHAEYVGRNILTLPLFPAMRDGDVERVIDTLNRILRAHARLPSAARTTQNATDAR
jgi:dTDP-4-amino-4,6-dideoxygalactose transaminase